MCRLCIQGVIYYGHCYQIGHGLNYLKFSFENVGDEEEIQVKHGNDVIYNTRKKGEACETKKSMLKQ